MTTVRQDFAISVVIPVLNEQDSVVPLYERVADALKEQPCWELVFVDDGSSDDTLEQLTTLVKSDNRVRAIEFRRNYGQTPATVAGIESARGEIIITMDGDLQNDPRDIPAFLEKIAEGYDIVVGWRERRQDGLVRRKIPSWIANWAIGKVTGVPIKDNGCSLKAYRAAVIKGIPLYSEMHRFIPAMASLAGSRTCEIPVRHHARVHGESKYGLKRIYKVLLDLVVVRTLLSIGSPIRFFAVLALPLLLISTVFLMAAIAGWLRADLSMVLLGTGLLWGIAGIFCIMAGLLAELVFLASEHKEHSLAKLNVQIDD